MFAKAIEELKTGYKRMEIVGFGLAGRVYVRGQVLGQIIRPGEAFAAHVAMVGPLAGMDAKMPSEIAFATESSPTEQTNKWTLPSVLPHVKFQVFLGSHALSTKRTGEAPLSLTLRRFIGLGPQKRGQSRGLTGLSPKKFTGGVCHVSAHPRVDRVVLVHVRLFGFFSFAP